MVSPSAFIPVSHISKVKPSSLFLLTCAFWKLGAITFTTKNSILQLTLDYVDILVVLFCISFILNIQNEYTLLTIQKLQFFASAQLLCLSENPYLLGEAAFEYIFLLFHPVEESINF